MTRIKGTAAKGGSRSRKGRLSRKKAKTTNRERAWLVVIAVSVSLFLLYLLYYFTIKPYSYRWQSCVGTKEYGVCIPPNYSVYGFDVSRHQGNICWDSIKGLVSHPTVPLSFVLIKATEGSDFKDSKFDSNFENARKAGLVRGAYHFFNVNSSGITQSDFFIHTANLEKGDLPPIVDVETKPDDIERFQRELKIWLERVEDYYGVKPVIYSSKKYKTKYLNSKLFDAYPQWMAHYYAQSISEDFDWLFWQYTDVGVLPGINEDVDLNIFNGSFEQLKQITLPDK